jgi:hypothetical protein
MRTGAGLSTDVAGWDLHTCRARAKVSCSQAWKTAESLAGSVGQTRCDTSAHSPVPLRRRCGQQRGIGAARLAAAGAQRLTDVFIFGFPAIAGKHWQCYYQGCHCHLVGSGVDCVWPNREIPTPYAVCLKLTIGTCGQFSKAWPMVKPGGRGRGRTFGFPVETLY